MRTMNITRGIFLRTTLLLFATAIPAAFSNAQGTGYCFGDPGSGTPCPCNNDNDGSVPGSGCDNGVFWSGAQLTGSGVADVTADTLRLATMHLEPNNAGLYFQADNDLSPGNLWGDGIRCAGGNLKRLGVRFADVRGYSDTSGFSYTISAKAGNISAGDTKYYQCWYRTTSNPPCGSGVNDFNTSNGYAITWGPGGGIYDEMVPIPAGTFDMGDHHDGMYDALPVHTVYLDALYMDVYEVSNSKYAGYLNTAYAEGRVTVTAGVVVQVGGAGEALCDTTTSSSESQITWNGSSFGVIAGKEEHPMGCVSWYGTCAYANQRSRDDGLTVCYDETNWTCNWTADGYRLPTEAEWEYAARGGEHGPYFRYPWGDAIDGSQANYWNSGDPYETGNDPWTTPEGYYDGNQIPLGVDMANGYGLYDMAGNVWERCWDLYDAYYYMSSPGSNPTGPASGIDHVVRGGCWGNTPLTLRTAVRGYTHPTTRNFYIAFRVVAVHP
jgi:formylglycine-generating enzyme required for sulfatase activity